MNVPHVDFLSVLIAAVVNLLIGFVWYSKYLFGKTPDPAMPIAKGAYGWNALLVLVTAYILGFFEAHLGVTTVTDGMFVGLLAWFGFVVTTQLSAVIWGKMPLKRFFIHSGCQLLAFLAMGGIIGA